jgi:hypothetical protein
MAIAAGPVYTTSIAASRNGIDVTKRIAQEMPDESLFAVLLMRARKKVATNWDIRWWDDRPNGWWTAVNNVAGYDDNDTDIVVDDETIIVAKDVIKNTRTGEQMLVTAVNNTTHTLTVTRGYGSTAAAAMLDDDNIMLLANAMEENSDTPTEKLSQPTEHTNYIQTIRTPFSESDLSAHSDLITDGTERKRLRRLKMLEHRLAIERTAIWGEAKKDTANKRFLTGGVLSFITTNVYDASGDLTETRFDEFCEEGFRYGGTSKVLIASPSIGARINSWAKAKIQTSSGETTYGLKLNYIQTFHGKVYLVNSRTFEHDYADCGILLDMPNIYYRPLQGSDTKLFTDIQSKGKDGWQDEYRTKFGMQVELEKTHAYLKNGL